MVVFVLAALAVIGYFAGSVPFGYLIGRLAGIDIRQAGSGNIGATNVGRVLGRHWGMLVLILDALKGFLPVWGLSSLTEFWLVAREPLPWYVQAGQRSALIGLAAVTGHLWPFSLGFRGGKGVSTSLGVALGLTVLFPETIGLAILVAALTWGMVTLTTRYVSLGSTLGTLSFSACYLLVSSAPFQKEQFGLTAFSLVIPALVFWRHRSNFGRMLRGEEPKWGRSR